jgi:hypothetical protein
MLVFDDYVPAGTSGVVYMYTPDVLSDILGSYDVIACQAVVDNVTFSVEGSFRLYLQQSADNRNFVFSNGSAAPPDIFLTSLSNTSTNTGITMYPGTYPLLGYVRFAVQFGEASTSAHVKLFVIQRDLA